MKRIKNGQYLYKGFRIVRHGYYEPEKSVWWEGVNEITGDADYHAHTKRDVKKLIDNDTKITK